MVSRREASAANERGRVLAEAGRYAEAVPHYLEAVRLAPSWAEPWFNLGIAYKHTGDFAGSLRASERALSIDREAAGEGAIWNLGIAATALGDWTKARRAWRDFGLTVPDGDGPIEMMREQTPIRLNPKAEAEVVWSIRIDPARARLRSIPLPVSSHRYDDLVLHDGAPNGYRKFAGQDVPVFDELALLEPSRYETWRLEIVAPAEDDVDALGIRFAKLGIHLEDWTGSVRMICEKCSTGVPHAHDGDEMVPAWREAREVALALRDGNPRPALDAWISEATGRSAPKLERVL
jgi:tetratricopeptide (TPR) repeat protein